MEGDTCPECAKQNKTRCLKFIHINLKEDILKCTDSECMFPFKNFLIKDNTTGIVATLHSAPTTSSYQSTSVEDIDLDFLTDLLDIPNARTTLTSDPSTISPVYTSKNEEAIETLKISRFLKNKSKDKSKKDKKPKYELTSNTKVDIRKTGRPLEILSSIQAMKFNAA